MHKLQRFFDIFWRSLVERSYYKDVLQASFGFSLKYLFFYLFLFSLATVLRNTVWFIPKLPAFEQGAQFIKKEIATLFPENLIITVINGEVSTNVQEPYAIPFPESWAQSVDSDTLNKTNLLVIDTQRTVDDYDTYDSLVIVTKTSIVYPDQSGYRVMPLAKDNNETVLDKKKYDFFVASVSPYFDNVLPAAKAFLIVYILIGPLFGAILGLMGNLFYLLIITLFVLLTSRLLKLTHGYSDLYRMSMHGLTLPILASYVLGVMGVWIPLAFTMIFIIWMTTVLQYLRDSASTVSQSPHA